MKKNFSYIFAVLCVVLWSCSPNNPEDNSISAVDLGLSVKWGSCNLGASSPEDYGGHYAWGEITEKRSYTVENYAFFDTSLLGQFKNIGTDISGTDYDVAHVQLKGNWHMPTKEEWAELREKCTWTYTNRNGVIGYQVTGPNDKSIFIPTAGYRLDTTLYYTNAVGSYWTASSLSTPNLISRAYAVEWEGDNTEDYEAHNTSEERFMGLSIRPVCGNK